MQPEEMTCTTHVALDLCDLTGVEHACVQCDARKATKVQSYMFIPSWFLAPSAHSLPQGFDQACRTSMLSTLPVSTSIPVRSSNLASNAADVTCVACICPNLYHLRVRTY